ncbi:hypothetical protein [Bacillus suaedae]|uniref:DUF3993 domain-containing protein n=1 Tax=Halalkalibacter suaedae TaxID=2822140 RepID=A0A940X0A6_9BACI|nr:hypothetical protein [Bacillus suaedae]MBP3952530.1 hypothetical protein [Bacillus suaedae]
MKKKLFLFILFILVLLSSQYIQDEAYNRNVTVKETQQHFDAYEIVIQDYIENPSEEKISKVYQAEDEFTEAYYTIMTRSESSERLYEKILPINSKPPSQNEISNLESQYSLVEKFNRQIENIAITEVYQADDFSLLLNEAKKMEFYQDDEISIETSEDEQYSIAINGSFHSDILRNYFIIKTADGNYFWEAPNSYSIHTSENKITLASEGIHYEISSDNVQ